MSLSEALQLLRRWVAVTWRGLRVGLRERGVHPVLPMRPHPDTSQCQSVLLARPRTRLKNRRRGWSLLEAMRTLVLLLTLPTCEKAFLE